MQDQPFDTQEVARSSAAAGRRFALALVAVTLFALGVRLYHLDYESLWYDELTQVATYHLPVTYVIPAAAGHGQPPLDYLIGVGLDRAGFAKSDWWVRLPAVLFGAASVALLGLFVRRVAGASAGISAALLVAVCPLHVVMSQEARPYTIFVFFALTTVLSFEAARRRHTIGAWAFFTASLTGMILTRWVAPQIVAISIAIYAGSAWLISRRNPNGPTRALETQRLWACFTGITAAYAVYGPLLGLIYDRARNAISMGDNIWLLSLAEQLTDAIHAVLGGYTTSALYDALPAPTWLLWLIAMLALIGVIATWSIAKKQQCPAACLLLTVMLPFPVLFASVYVSMTTIAPKPQYLLLMCVPLLALVAIAADRLSGLLVARNRIGPALVLVAVIGAVVVPMASASLTLLNTQDKRDWRGLQAYLRRHAQEDDAFAVVGANAVPGVFHAVAGGKNRYGMGWARFQTIALDTTPDALEPETWGRSGNVVWIVGIDDGLYSGTTQLPAPTEYPDRVTVKAFNGVFVVGLPGSTRALDRLAEGLSIITKDLPDKSAVVTAPLFCGRLMLADGRIPETNEFFSRALRQCRSKAETETLRRDYLPAPLSANAITSSTGP